MLIFLICSFVYILIFTIDFFIKKKVNNKDTKIYSLILIITLLEIILSIMNYYTISNINIINIIITKIYLILCLSWITLYNFYSNNKLLNLEKKYNFIPNILYYILILILPLKININSNLIIYSGISSDFTKFIIGIYSILFLLSLLINLKKLSNKEILLVLFNCIFIFLFFITYNNFNILIIGHILICSITYFLIDNIELEYTKQSLEKARNIKSDFLSSMSHELRTPLNAIVGLSELISTNNNIDEIHDDAKDVVTASKNLLEIISDILYINDIESNKIQINETTYNPYEEFNSIIKSLKKTIDNNVKLNINIQDGIPKCLYGDKDKIKLIITNLISNSIKYTNHGFINFNVKYNIKGNKCYINIEVIDTGVGIDEEQMNVLFNKFQRRKKDINTNISGIGLGLSITKSLVKMLDGNIEVKSKYGKGSTFNIYIKQKIIFDKNYKKANNKIIKQKN